MRIFIFQKLGNCVALAPRQTSRLPGGYSVLTSKNSDFKSSYCTSEVELDIKQQNTDRQTRFKAKDLGNGVK